jgi:subtilisin family serine protease
MVTSITTVDGTFSGSTLAAIGTPGFIGDNDPSVNQGGQFSHGTMVAGCASARTNNGIGIAGIGYKAKLLFTKHFADDQPPGDYSSNTYEGVLYAATHGARIINCSWEITIEAPSLRILSRTLRST